MKLNSKKIKNSVYGFFYVSFLMSPSALAHLRCSESLGGMMPNPISDAIEKDYYAAKETYKNPATRGAESKLVNKIKQALGLVFADPILQSLNENKELNLRGSFIAASDLAFISKRLKREVAPGYHQSLYIRSGERHSVVAFGGVHTHPSYRVSKFAPKSYKFASRKVETDPNNVFGISSADISKLPVNRDSSLIQYVEYIVLGDGNVIQFWKTLEDGISFINVSLLPNPELIYFQFDCPGYSRGKGILVYWDSIELEPPKLF